MARLSRLAERGAWRGAGALREKGDAHFAVALFDQHVAGAGVDAA